MDYNKKGKSNHKKKDSDSFQSHRKYIKKFFNKRNMPIARLLTTTGKIEFNYEKQS